MAEIAFPEPWQRLARRLSIEARRLTRGSGTPRDKVRTLLKRLSHSSDMAVAAKAAQDLDSRYQPRTKDDGSLLFLGRVEAGAALGAFIGRSGLAGAALEGERVTGDALRDAFREASRPTESSVVTLVVLDGLDLDGNAHQLPPGAGPSLRRLDRSFMEEFFDGMPPGKISSAQLEGLAALEFRSSAPNPPWTPTVIDLGSVAQKVRREAWPWAAYVNLFSGEGFVQPVAVNKRGDSLICSPAIRATIAAEPVWEPRFVPVGEDEWVEVEEPFFSMTAEATKLLAFFNEMEAARRKAAVTGHRADTALRLFVRYVESARQMSDFGASDDEDVVERSIADGATLMEAITLEPQERGKGKKMASRLASLLAHLPANQTALAAEIEDAYRVRSDLVHADARPSREVLNSVAALFARLTRPALLAFLRSGGDVRDVIRCATDAGHAAQMNALAGCPAADGCSGLVDGRRPPGVPSYRSVGQSPGARALARLPGIARPGSTRGTPVSTMSPPPRSIPRDSR